MSTVRIAMWSGPRNISTAMMRAWENRGDTVVVDEPLYAAYLVGSGKNHPMRDAIVASQSNDWQIVVETLVESPAPIFYQKHMTHHLLPSMGRDWLDELTNCFLIREPRAVVASYANKREDVTLEDLGMPQQLEIFERASAHETVVLLARDVLDKPRRAMQALCEAVGVSFDEAMLSWPAGTRESDGVWASHWYESVIRSTGFEAHVERAIALPSSLELIAKACEPYFNAMVQQRLRF